MWGCCARPCALAAGQIRVALALLALIALLSVPKKLNIRQRQRESQWSEWNEKTPSHHLWGPWLLAALAVMMVLGALANQEGEVKTEQCQHM